MNANNSAVPFGAGLVAGLLVAGLAKLMIAGIVIIGGVNSLMPKPTKEQDTCKSGQKQN